MDDIKGNGNGKKEWVAEGKIDGELMRVWLYPEHRRAITNAGYKVTWDEPQIIVADPPTVALVEHSGRRRVAAVLTIGTQDKWIEIKQKR